MALPVNIESLVHGNTVEWERLEFKQGWNPEDVMHTMCAFANDMHNWGGGYIIVGIAEQDGQPIFPPAGLQQNKLDAIQKEIIQLGHKLQPNYFPITQPYLLQGKHILVLWCPAGDNRPYTAPTTLGAGAQRQPYIRVTSNSIIAQGENLRRLQELTARIPFDDRVNNQASIQDFDLGLIQAYLQEIKSELFAESTHMLFPELCRSMHIVRGPQEDLRPVNVGLMFFCSEPHIFFKRAWIELVWHKDGSGQNFKEYYFKGPLQMQLRDTLSFLSSNIISEQVIKKPDKAEAVRFFNFPFAAIEEALSNAVYHKSYELGSPIEVQVWPDKIEILSYPGPIPPVDAVVLSTHKRIVAREYRNRRIGDFLKELRLTEGRGTGFPTIYKAMATNGSPDPVFTTDEQTYVLVTLSAHPLTVVNNQVGDQASNHVIDIIFSTLDDIVSYSNQVSNQVSNQASDQVSDIISNNIHGRVKDILEECIDWIRRADLFLHMGLSNQTANREKYLDPLIRLGWVEMEYPLKKTNPKQRYRITNSGKRVLNLMRIV
ncbi:MAG: RNA-binding domain-containing protein [Lentimicrobium sp.]